MNLNFASSHCLYLIAELDPQTILKVVNFIHGDEHNHKNQQAEEPSSRLKASVLIYKRRLTRGANFNDHIYEYQ